MNSVVILFLVIVLLVRWSLAPRRERSTSFVIYKSGVVIATLAAAVLAFAGAIPPFAAANTAWFLLLAALLFALPTVIVTRAP